MKATEKKKEAAPEKSKEVPSNFKYKLVRKKDNLTVEANEVSYLFWKSNGTFQALGYAPSEGASMALDLEFGVKSAHITDQITKIVEISDNCVCFETKDGLHELTIAK